MASGELYDKPVALINASMRSTHAQASLAETLTVMTARLVPEASVKLSLRCNKIDQGEILPILEISRALRSGVRAFALAIESRRDEKPVESIPSE